MEQLGATVGHWASSLVETRRSVTRAVPLGSIVLGIEGLPPSVVFHLGLDTLCPM